MSVQEVMQVVRRDRAHYDNSGGGMTIGGGEPSLQKDFLYGLAKAAYDEGYSLCVDTCLHGSWEAFESVLPFTDLFLVDLKHVDSRTHRVLTGVGNEIIQENMRRMANTGANVRVRIPCIPGYNGTWENLKASATLLKTLGWRDVDIIPYHKLGANKYAALGRNYPMPDEIEELDFHAVQDYFRSEGLRCEII